MTTASLDPALNRALLAARDKRERRGAAGDGTVVVERLEPEEALALDGLLSLSRRKPVLAGATLRVSLSQFEAALRSCGSVPRAEYERVGGRPVRDLPAERATRRESRAGFHSWLYSHEVVQAHPAVAVWFDRALEQGRVHSGMRPLVEQALRILAALPPTETTQRTVLAARLLDGDPHALDVGTPLHGLMVALLATAANLDPDASVRQVWAAWNVLVDPIASNVTALNLPAVGDGALADALRGMRGRHVVLTYRQLSASDPGWPSGVPCFSCENPSVLIAAEEALGEESPPLVCTGGRPSDAVRLLFSIVRRAGAQIHHHGDFDASGVQILRDLEERYGAMAWRFDLESLDEALRDQGRPISDRYGSTLEDAVRKLPSGLPEELVIDALIADLRAAPL